mmetsp:Transcript_5369/g.13494  ORF Transcript_5369/g.13494 Transcript_5369/m.13494 type:complete len:106 (-) Transcript_5369:82-399(-)
MLSFRLSTRRSTVPTLLGTVACEASGAFYEQFMNSAVCCDKKGDKIYAIVFKFCSAEYVEFICDDKTNDFGFRMLCRYCFDRDDCSRNVLGVLTKTVRYYLVRWQ